jgi:tetratricopeptide (TPR) repeat protein
MSESTAGEATKVFMSYSRKDFDVVSKLIDALAEHDDIEVFRDTDDIAPTEEWKGRLEQLIAESDTIVFALSPHSVASEVCRWEIEYAEGLNKRFAPVVIADVEPALIPPSLSKYNYIFFNKRGQFNKALTNLVTALNTDVVWVREHTRLGELARRWDAARGDGAQPLRGNELIEAETWLASQPHNAPSPTELHREFVRQSRHAATRRQQLFAGVSIAAALVMAVLTVFAFQQRNIAIENERRANIERDRAERNLGQALDAADTLVVEIADGMKDVTGVPIEFTSAILERAEAVLEGLEDSDGDTAIQHRQAVMLISFVRAYQTLGDLEEAASRASQALVLMLSLVEADPDNAAWQRDLFRAHQKMGDVLRAQGKLNAAQENYKTALTIARQLAEAEPEDTGRQRDVAAGHEAIGDALRVQSRPAEALEAYEAGHAIVVTLADGDPANEQLQRSLALSHNKIGDVLRAQGNLDGALERYRISLDIIEALAAASPRNAGLQFDLAIRHERVGDALMGQGKFDEALAAYEARHAIISALAATDPKNTTWQRDLSVSHERVGEVKGLQGSSAEALASFEASLEIRQRLAARDETNVIWQRDLSVSHNKIGDLHIAESRLDEALASYGASLEIRERLADGNPDNAEWQRDLYATHDRIGNVQLAQGVPWDALASYEAALGIARGLTDADPSNASWQRDLSVMYNRVGNVFTALGSTAEALENFRAALVIVDRMVELEPSNTEWQLDLVISHIYMARLGDEPAQHWGKVVEVLRGLNDDGLLSDVHKQWLIIAEANVNRLADE